MLLGLTELILFLLACWDGTSRSSGKSVELAAQPSSLKLFQSGFKAVSLSFRLLGIKPSPVRERERKQHSE